MKFGRLGRKKVVGRRRRRKRGSKNFSPAHCSYYTDPTSPCSTVSMSMVRWGRREKPIQTVSVRFTQTGFPNLVLVGWFPRIGIHGCVIVHIISMLPSS